MLELKGLEQYFDHLKEDKITDFKNPMCINCNECCGMLTLITMEEYDFLTNYFETDPEGRKIFRRGINKIKKHYRRGTLYLMCPLSDDQKRCSIYEIRPSICRTFHCKSDCHEDNRKHVDEVMAKPHKSIFDLFMER